MAAAVVQPPVAPVDDRCGDRRCWTGITTTWVEWNGQRWHRYCLPLPVAAADRLPTCELETAAV